MYSLSAPALKKEPRPKITRSTAPPKRALHVLFSLPRMYYQPHPPNQARGAPRQPALSLGFCRRAAPRALPFRSGLFFSPCSFCPSFFVESAKTEISVPPSTQMPGKVLPAAAAGEATPPPPPPPLFAVLVLSSLSSLFSSSSLRAAFFVTKRTRAHPSRPFKNPRRERRRRPGPPPRKEDGRRRQPPRLPPPPPWPRACSSA